MSASICLRNALMCVSSSLTREPPRATTLAHHGASVHTASCTPLAQLPEFESLHRTVKLRPPPRKRFSSTRNRPPKWGIVNPRKRGLVRAGYAQASDPSSQLRGYTPIHAEASVRIRPRLEGRRCPLRDRLFSAGRCEQSLKPGSNPYG